MDIELILGDGSSYPFKGKFYAIDRQIDVRTGTLRVAATFPNPRYLLRPGQFVRVRVQSGIRKGALLIPQRAVMELQGSYQVAVVGPDNRVDVRQVKPGERIGALWMIDSGPQAGRACRGGRGREGQAGDGRDPETLRLPATADPGASPKPAGRPGAGGKVDPMYRFFIRRPIVAMVIAIVTVIIGLVSMAGLPVAQYPNIVPPEILMQATYRGRRRAGDRAVGGRPPRAADERRGQHELHVFPQSQQRADAADRELRRQDRSEHRPGTHPVCGSPRRNGSSRSTCGTSG